MKKEFPSYRNCMYELEDGLSNRDKVILEKYLRYCAFTAGEGKLAQRRRYVIQFSDLAEVPYHKFTKEIIEDIYSLVKNSNKEISGKNECVKHLKHFVNWFFDDPLLLKNVKLFYHKNGINTRKLNPSTLIRAEEVEALIRSCETLKHKALITFFLELGLRPHEVLSLRWEDIRVEGDVGEVKVFSSKVKESRTLPFKTSLIHILRWKDEYQFPDLSERHFVFPSENDPFKSANPRYMDVLFRRLCKKAGIRHIYPYLARHTRLTDMYKNLPEQVASSFAGHGSNMGAVYTHLNTQDIRQVVLERIYNIKDPQLSTLTAKKLNEEIEDLRSQMKTLVKDFENRRKYYDNKPL